VIYMIIRMDFLINDILELFGVLCIYMLFDIACTLYHSFPHIFFSNSKPKTNFNFNYLLLLLFMQ